MKFRSQGSATLKDAVAALIAFVGAWWAAGPALAGPTVIAAVSACGIRLQYRFARQAERDQVLGVRRVERRHFYLERFDREAQRWLNSYRNEDYRAFAERMLTSIRFALDEYLHRDCLTVEEQNRGAARVRRDRLMTLAPVLGRMMAERFLSPEYVFPEGFGDWMADCGWSAEEINRIAIDPAAADLLRLQAIVNRPVGESLADVARHHLDSAKLKATEDQLDGFVTPPLPEADKVFEAFTGSDSPSNRPALPA